MSDMHRSLSGVTVMVTGASGRIGRVATEHLVRHGALVTAMCEQGREPEAAQRIVYGDTTSPDDVERAIEGADAIVHLAALAHRDAGSPYDVYVNNVVSSFAVLTSAAQRGVRRAVVAGSVNRYGLPQGIDRHARPPYLPIDRTIPSDVSDWYSLSKLNDENTSRMVWRRWGMDVVTLRFPHVNTMDAIAEVSRRLTEEPEPGLTEAWAYLDVRDAARAIELALTAPTAGAVAFYLAAGTTSLPYRTDEILDTLYPEVPRRRPFAGREVPMDLGDARSLIGFTAQYELDLGERDIPDEWRARAREADHDRIRGDET
jgi:nucleoside-diphosphate-sugar epimerase